jgi:hypothetical protein
MKLKAATWKDLFIATAKFPQRSPGQPYGQHLEALARCLKWKPQAPDFWYEYGFVGQTNTSGPHTPNYHTDIYGLLPLLYAQKLFIKTTTK